MNAVHVRGAFEDVELQVFGGVAVVTGLFAYEASVGDDESSGRVRSSVFMMDDAGDWKITHEHLSGCPVPE